MLSVCTSNVRNVKFLGVSTPVRREQLRGPGHAGVRDLLAKARAAAAHRLLQVGPKPGRKDLRRRSRRRLQEDGHRHHRKRGCGPAQQVGHVLSSLSSGHCLLRLGNPKIRPSGVGQQAAEMGLSNPIFRMTVEGKCVS